MIEAAGFFTEVVWRAGAMAVILARAATMPAGADVP